MIFDQLSNIEKYRGLYPCLDTAIDYILNHDLHRLPLGRTEVAGSDVFINVMEAATAPADTKQYEFHKNYMDIQIDLEGAERILTGDAASMEIESYDADSDCGFVRCRNLAGCLIGPGNFTICMANEPHMPGIFAGDPGESGDSRESGDSADALQPSEKIRKCVFKVHI